MTNRKTLIGLLVLGGVLLLSAGVAYVVLRSDVVRTYFRPYPPDTSPPPLEELTPPPSLADMAEQYPQLAPVLTDPELDSVYKEFLLAYQEGGQDAAVELARQRGLLTPDGDLRVNLVLDTEDHAPLVSQLEAIGVTVVSAYRDRVNVAVPLALFEAQLEGGAPEAIFEQLGELEHVIAVRLPQVRVTEGAASLPLVQEGRNVEGEGVGKIAADVWHQAGFTGSGVRVGVLDLGFAGHENLLGVELPDDVPVATFGWHDEEEIHGTACAEIVHEVAPDAELFFAWYDGTDAAMGEAVEWLLDQGVDIISHSANGLVGPRDGSAWDAQLVDDLAAKGILWVNSAGNEAFSHYQGTFTDEDSDGFHEFAPGEEMLALYNAGGVLVFLMWEDDWNQAALDYDLFLYDVTGDVLFSSEDVQSGEAGQEPVEGIQYETGEETVYAAIKAYDVDQVDRPVLLDIFTNSGTEVAYASADHSIGPPADALGSLTVGAANWWDDSLAGYSSQGPTTDGRLKPEISAPTSVSGFNYGDAAVDDEDSGFNGTSASCPHVAGAAALVWQAYPEFTRQDVWDFLLDNALDLGAAGPDTGYGYGRLQLPSPPSVPVATPPQSAAPGPAVTPAPLSPPTPVAFVTPAPPSRSGGWLTLAGAGLVVGGLSCAGLGLLFIGGLGLLILRLRARRVRSVPAVAPGTPLIHEPDVPLRPLSSSSQPRRCESCGAVLRPGARFCPACGRPLASGSRSRVCERCGAQLKEDARFCPRCGKQV
jgi:subtilisin family serine protease